MAKSFRLCEVCSSAVAPAIRSALSAGFRKNLASLISFHFGPEFIDLDHRFYVGTSQLELGNGGRPEQRTLLFGALDEFCEACRRTYRQSFPTFSARSFWRSFRLCVIRAQLTKLLGAFD